MCRLRKLLVKNFVVISQRKKKDSSWINIDSLLKSLNHEQRKHKLPTCCRAKLVIQKEQK